MNSVPEKKLKQARLSFNKVIISKKRKLENDSDDTDEIKCRKVDNELPESNLEDIVENNQNAENVLNISYPENKFVTSDEVGFDNSLNIQPITARQEMDVSIDSEDLNLSLVLDSCDSVPCETTIINVEVEKEISHITSLNSDSVVKIKHQDSVEHVPDGLSLMKLTSLPKKMTCKQLQRKLEAETKKKELEKVRQEKEKKRNEERELKEKKRLAELEAKNEEKRQKEEEKRKREEERRIKEEEKRRQKEEEKRLKEEEKRAKEEEKRLKVEEKRLKEEQDRKQKEKVAAVFTNFFLPKTKFSNSKVSTECSAATNVPRFMPFEVKADVKLADMVMVTLSTEQKAYLDKILHEPGQIDEQHLYLSLLKCNDYKPGHSGYKGPVRLILDDKDMNIGGLSENENEKLNRYQWKLLQFCENRRPAFWGTWTKRSRVISGRRPFKCDTAYFEYDIDSDDEWLEEPGESLHGSDDDKESDDDYDVDKDFMVPHGYLSDEEIQEDDDGCTTNTNKLKLNLLEKELEAELREKTSKLIARQYGCIWIPNFTSQNENAEDVQNLLLTFRAVYNEEHTPFNILYENSSAQNTPSARIKIHSVLPEQYIPDLIRLAHGYKSRLKTLIVEFSAFLQEEKQDTNISEISIKNKAKEIALWQSNLNCWYVADDVRKHYHLEELKHCERQWNYVLDSQPIIPEQYMPDLIRLLHGNKNSAKNLSIEFQCFLKQQDSESNVTSASIKKVQKEISVWQQNKACWFVSEEVRSKFNLSDLSYLDNTWKYVSSCCQSFVLQKNILKPTTNEKVQCSTNNGQSITSPTPKHSSITKFLKVLTAEEKERQLKAAVAVASKKTEPLSPVTDAYNSPKSNQIPSNRFQADEFSENRIDLFSCKEDARKKLFASVANVKSVDCLSTTGPLLSPIVTTFCHTETEKMPKHDVNMVEDQVGIVKKNVDTKVAKEFPTPHSQKRQLTEISHPNTDGVKNTSANESNITIKRGKKYATLITVGKIKE